MENKNQDLFLTRLKEFDDSELSHQERPFWDDRLIFHIDTPNTSQMNFADKVYMYLQTWWSPRISLLAAVLSGLYGGVDLTVWRWAFTPYVEDILWKLSCLIIACAMPCIYSLLLPVSSIMVSLIPDQEISSSKALFIGLPWLLLR
ncbi:hypothetical protein FOXYSP1_19811 [Fusarium oxysporum f. sp. phaseoli]